MAVNSALVTVLLGANCPFPTPSTSPFAAASSINDLPQCVGVSVKVAAFSTTTCEALKYELMVTYHMPPICTGLAETNSNFFLASLYRNAPHCAGIFFMLFGIEIGRAHV